MRNTKHGRPTIGVLAGTQIYYGTILGNFTGPVLHGIYSAALERRCNLMLACGMEYTLPRPAWPVPSPEADFVPVGPWNTDGLLVINPLLLPERSEYIQELLAASHPVVFITRGENGPTVTVDNDGGMRLALKHLLDHGHRRIAFIAGRPEDPEGDSGIRWKTYRSFVQEYGLAANDSLFAFGYHGIRGGESAMREILKSGAEFSAVLASNDESAIGALTVLRESGRRIPEDVAVIGCDDIPEALTQYPPLTTLHSSPFRMGFQALEVLLNSIEGQTPESRSIQVPMQLVIRHSCGCQPGNIIQPALFPGGRAPAGEDREKLLAKFVQAMTENVLVGVRRLSLEEVHSLCRKLVDAFLQSLERGEAKVFNRTMDEILARVEEMGEDPHIWHIAVSTLESSLALLRDRKDWDRIQLQSEEMVNDARVTISESVRRQNLRHMIQQQWLTAQLGLMNDRLLTALDEAQIFEIMANHLPQLGVQNSGVAFYKSEGEDEVAWSVLRKVAGGEGTETRFRSRQFPPADLYPEIFRLVLLPLGNRVERSGFAVFDASNLDVCASIVWQLVVFLKVVHLYREATEGRRLAEEANRLKSRFLSTVSHELRTPLNLIVGLSDMLVQEEGKGESETHWEDLRRIHASAQHLDGLIQDVLDLARNEMGQLKLVCEPLDLAKALEVVIDVGEQLVHDKGLKWKVAIPKSLPKVWGDRTRLRQVVLNLINNAVKFTSQGTVTLRIRAKKGTVIITVSDTGLGILPEEQSVIFDEFRQSERTTERGYGGLGLGLAICKRLVEMHGGTIGVRSSGEEGAGSTFYFSLPAMESVTRSDRPEPLSPSQTVLLLSERSGNGERLKQYLTRRGYEVEVVWIDANTDWSPRWLKSLPGAVILEQGTVTKQGWEILKLLRENPLTREVPVLFYSLDGSDNSGSMLELNYLTKPMNKTDLIQALERLGLEKGPNRQEQTILVVDDDPSSLEMHARMVALWSADFRILKARNGKEALAVIRETHPNLVLLDLMMPELDGFGVLEAMRSDENSRNIPVVVLTGQTLTVEDMTKLNRGVSSILAKGLFSAEETLSYVESALARSKTLGGETQRVVRKAMAFLHEHYMEPISLKDAARYVGMSKEYLARCFHQEVGITLVTYLNRYRVHQAQALLQESERSLTEIALDVGFSSSTYFSRVFRQETGMPPSQFKKSSIPIQAAGVSSHPKPDSING